MGFSSDTLNAFHFFFAGFEIDYEAETSDFTNECKEFMNKFVLKIFSGRW